MACAPSYKSVEVVVMYEVFNLVLQVVALLGVMSVVMEEAVVASTVTFLGSSPHQVGGFEESFLLDLEEDLSPSEMLGSRGMACSALSILFFGSLSGGP
ncbi:hypothetical protein B296_00006914 [Ensete ventricosum]|uniref:Uncharacterized protein n=1 Tax=Ensete ventricosum TaxID=4639 RepID=A0A426ZVL3_ENSVE|nr:hypothetical protein B296_00006914 [Ensete ventricosum]